MEPLPPPPHDPSSINSSSISQHYLAEIKYPNIPDTISIDKIFNVLQKIRTTSKPLFYKWQPLYKPKHGEIYLEQKYPVTRDSVLGDQFSIVDDGYLWSSVPKPEVKDHLGQQIEVFRWLEGYCPGDKFFSVTKTEYRLKTPNNVLFLIHYLSVKNPCVPVKNALPSTKISPIYLQQQFFQNLKQQLAQINLMRRSPSPVPGKPSQPPIHKNSQIGKSSNFPAGQQKLANLPQTTAIKSAGSADVPNSENTLDVFDSFGDYEAAQYRFSVVKPVLYRLLESKGSSQPVFKPEQLPEGLENDIIAAIQKKIDTMNDHSDALSRTHYELLEEHKLRRTSFWEIFNLIAETNTEGQLIEIEKRFRTEMDTSMDVDSTGVKPVYLSL